MKRKISAILAADIVGYSRLVADDEEETVRRLAIYRAVFDDLTARFDGRIVNTVGDAVLAEFPSSVDAVRCAIDVQASIRARNLAYLPSRQITLRIGITLGDVVDREGELFGDGVNIAARLEGLALPGGICVSRTVYEQVANKLSVRFDDMGPQHVKNMPNPIHAYMIAPYSDEAEDLGGRSRGAATGKRSLLLAGSAVVVAIIVAAVVIALQLHGPEQASTGAESASLGGRPAGATSQDITRRFDDAKVRALAMSQGIPLPPTLRILTPASTVPAKITEYLGAWGGDKRWNGGGRQAILVIESVDDAGTALGVYAQGLPRNQNAANQPPARHGSFVGTIADKGLFFAWGPSKFTFRIAPDGTMWGHREAARDPGQFDLTITLERIE